MSKLALGLGMVAAASGEVYFKETFDTMDGWVKSSFKEDEGTAGEFKLSAGKYFEDEAKDQGIQTSTDARFYALSKKIETPFSNEGKDLVIQFSVKHEQKIDCGGGYVKVFPSSVNGEEMTGDSPYNIMFGPDICGTSNKKVHAIFRYNDKNLLIKKQVACLDDEFTHTYTLVVKPDNTFQIKIDGEEKAGGSLFDEWDFLEPKMINDPDQSKPSDWVDETHIDDPEDVKPEGYDEIPAEIVDPEAEQPDDWDEEDDGEWEAPMIDNPEYKGEWKAKRIENPDYKGEWEHPQIANPDYVEDNTVYKYDDFGLVGFDLWQVKSGSIFDNVIITDSVEEADAFYEENKSRLAAEKAKAEEEAAEVAAKEEAEAKAAAEEAQAASAEEADEEFVEDEDFEAEAKEEL